MKKVLVYLLLLVPGLSFGQFTDEVLYQAYLTQDMVTWDQYLTMNAWETLPSLYERARYLNYEYGYMATAVDEKKEDAKERVEAYGRHIDQMAECMNQATILTYRSAYYAYRAKLNAKEFISMGFKAMNTAKEAVAADSTNVLALALMGCVDFYAPGMLGGSKTRALEAFDKAEAIYHQTGDTVAKWNYPALEMQRAMCLEKTGRLDEAIALCRKMLKRDPNFIFIRDEYLPQLEKKRKKQGK